MQIQEWCKGDKTLIRIYKIQSKPHINAESNKNYHTSSVMENKSPEAFYSEKKKIHD